MVVSEGTGVGVLTRAAPRPAVPRSAAGAAAFAEQRLQVNAGALRALGGGQGPLALCLHGYALTADIWRPNLPALIAAGHRALAIDLPGHGESFHPRRPFGVRALAEVVIELLDRHVPDGGPVTLIGHSLGGGVASEVALRRPERVRRLVLVNAFGLSNPVLSMAERPRFWTHIGLPSAFQMLFGWRDWVYRRIAALSVHAPGRLPREHFVLRYTGGWRHNHIGRALVGAGVLGEHLTPRRSHAFVQRRRALRVPTLIFWGEGDEVLEVAQGHRAQALIPGARLHVLPDCGHMTNVEHPEAFNRLVVEFLS